MKRNEKKFVEVFKKGNEKIGKLIEKIKYMAVTASGLQKEKKRMKS